MKLNYNGTAVVLNDLHIPFQDQRVIREVELFIKELQPNLLLYPGDIADFYPLSHFDKNPSRKETLQTELTLVANMFKRHRTLCPNARMIFELGNHEDRLRSYLWSQSPALSSLECLTIEQLFKLKENEVKMVDYAEGIMINDNFLVTHGELIRAHSGYTAKGMSDKYGGSGMHGHSHRLGSYYKRDRFNVYGWFENGCLCDLEPDYMVHPDWQQGFSVITFKSGRFWVEPIQIIHRKFIYGSKLYGSGGKKRE